MTEFIQVLTTTDARFRAEEIARGLVEQRLAACVQIIGPMTSFFRWQEKIDAAEEWLCLAKTRSDLFAEVEAAIRARHTYEVPEILAVPISKGHAAYLAWLGSELGGGRQS
jgi:periplasmic divalent cation tolerance protein